MSASRVLGLVVTSSWLVAGCSSAKKIDVGGGCMINSDCNSPLSCSFGKCHTACVQTRDCPLGQSCVMAAGGSVCQLPAEADCRTATCEIGTLCAVDYHCRTVCQSPTNCTPGQVCVSNVCADSTDLDPNGQLPQTAPPKVDSGVDAIVCPTGSETCACYGNDTCNAGLTCASHLCVSLGTGGSGGGGDASAADVPAKVSDSSFPDKPVDPGKDGAGAAVVPEAGAELPLSGGADESEGVMPQAVILAKGTLPDATQVLFNALSANEKLNAQRVGSFLVWSKNLSEFSSTGLPSNFSTTALPNTVTLHFAVSSDKRFYFGASGTLPDLLVCIGSFYSSPYQNNWEQFWPDFWDQNADSKLDDGRLQAKNIALVGMGFRELSQLSTAGYFTNFPAGTYEFRNASAVQVFHRFSQNVYWLGHLIYISNGNENAKEGWESMYNQLWCNFADPANTGTSTRIFFLQYTNPVASYVYSCNTNNNSNETWTYLDDVLFNHQKNWGQSVARRGNAYPSKISLVGTKTWSHINPSVSVTFLGGSMDVIDRSETPSAGHRINPMPEIVVLEPNKWYPPVTTSTGGPDGGST